jgi:hypothetical protein
VAIGNIDAVYGRFVTRVRIALWKRQTQAMMCWQPPVLKGTDAYSSSSEAACHILKMSWPGYPALTCEAACRFTREYWKARRNGSWSNVSNLYGQ